MKSLTLWQRAALAVRIATGGIDVTPGSPGYALLQGITPGGYGAIGNPPKRGTREILLAYSEMPWLRACAGRVGDSMAAIQWKLYYAKRAGAAKAHRFKALQRAPLAMRAKLLAQHKDELTEVTEHPLLDVLADANSFHVGLTVRRLQAIWLDLVGECFLLKERNALGMPVQLWPLAPHWIMSTPTPANPVYRLSYRGYQATIPATEIFAMLDPDPENPYGRGSGMAKTLSDELETDEYAARHTRQMFFNQAKPDILITAPTLTPEETKRIELDWNFKNRGYMKAFKAHFLNKDVKVTEFDTTDLRSMQFVALRQFERDTILQVWGMPPEIMGVIENSNRATIDGADFLYTSKVIVPRAEFQRANLQENFVPEFDERLILDYVSPVAEDREFKLKVIQAAPWSHRVDEVRELAGSSELEDGAGDVFAKPFQYSFSPDLEDAEPVVDPTVLPPTGDAGDLIPNTPAAPKTIRRLDGTLRKETAVERLANRLEPRLRREFMLAVQRVRGQIDVEELARAVEAGQIGRVEAAMRLAELSDGLGRAATVASTAFLQAGTIAAADLTSAGVEIAFDLTNPRAIAWVQANAARLVTGITDPTRAAIRALVEAAFREGITPAQLARELREVIGLTSSQAEAVQNFRRTLLEQGLDEDVIDGRTERYAAAQLGRRANTIARTEILSASNEGQQELWRQGVEAGLLARESTQREWITTPDDRLDVEVCEPMDGQTRGLEEPFTTGIGEAVMVPPAHPNCRCTIGLRFTRRSFTQIVRQAIEPMRADLLALITRRRKSTKRVERDPHTKDIVAVHEEEL